MLEHVLTKFESSRDLIYSCSPVDVSNTDGGDSVARTVDRAAQVDVSVVLVELYFTTDRVVFRREFM